MPENAYLSPGDQWEQDKYISPGDQWEQERHLPQRLHDQEKRYSPSLKTLGGYSYEDSQTPAEEQQKYEDWELKEKCDTQGNLYNEIIGKYKSGELTTEEANKMVEDANDYFVPFGCPELPEFEPLLPTFAAKH